MDENTKKDLARKLKMHSALLKLGLSEYKKLKRPKLK